MIRRFSSDSVKSDQSIMLDFFQTGGGSSPRNAGSIDSDISQPLPSNPISKYTKQENQGLTVYELFNFLGMSDQIKLRVDCCPGI
jgi:hypothetical protein